MVARSPHFDDSVFLDDRLATPENLGGLRRFSPQELVPQHPVRSLKEKPAGDRPGRRTRWWSVAAAGGAILVAAATVFCVRCHETTVRIQIDDPDIAVHFDKDTLTFDDRGTKIHVKPGKQNTLAVTAKGGTRLIKGSFVLKKGQKIVLTVSIAADGSIVVKPNDGKPTRAKRGSTSRDKQAVAKSAKTLEQLVRKMPSPTRSRKAIPQQHASDDAIAREVYTLRLKTRRTKGRFSWTAYAASGTRRKKGGGHRRFP